MGFVSFVNFVSFATPVGRTSCARLAVVCAALLLASGCTTPPPVRVTNAAQSAASAFSQRAAGALQRGDPTTALALYEQALAAADSVEDFETSGATLLNLALVQARLGRLQQAHQQVDRILQAPGRYAVTLQSQAATRKALLFLGAAELQSALTWVDRAQDTCPQPCALAAVWANVRAHVALERGDALAAVGYANQAATQAARAGAGAGAEAEAEALPQAEQANALRLLGRAQTRLGRHDAAAAALQQALDLDRALGLPERIALDLFYAGDNAALGGLPSEARERYERALRVSVAAGLPRITALVQARLDALGPGPGTSLAPPLVPLPAPTP